MNNTPEPVFCALFCEDIREELHDKFSLVGILGVNLYVDELPKLIPKLALTIRSIIAFEDEIGDISVSITRDEQMLIEEKISSDQIKLIFKNKQELNSDFGILDLNFMPSQITINSPCKLIANVEYKSKKYIAGILNISQK